MRNPLIVPITQSTAPRIHDTDIGVYVDVGAVFPGVTANEASLLEVLAQLSRDEALFWCAHINILTSGFGPQLNRVDRQQKALNLLCTVEEISAVNTFAKAHRGIQNVNVFFRGQMLELARWIFEGRA